MLDHGPKKTWICPNGCDVRTAPCSHLSSLISNGRTNSVNALPVANVESIRRKKIVQDLELKSASEYEFEFRKKLIEIGLSQAATDILTMRFVYDMSLRDIARDLGFIHAMGVYRIINDSMVYLKAAGFGK